MSDKKFQLLFQYIMKNNHCVTFILQPYRFWKI